MISAARYFGDAKFLAIVGSSVQVYPARWAVYTITTSTNGIGPILPAVDSVEIMPGGPVAHFLNVGANTMSVRDSASNVLATVNAGQFVEVHLRDKATAAGTWDVRTGTIKT